MPLSSIVTNTGSAVALQNLAATQAQLATSQIRISTGLKVNSAKDNGAIWAIAQTEKAQVVSNEAVTNSLNGAKSVIDATLAAGSNLAELLNNLRAKALAASDAGVDNASRTQYQNEYTKLATSYANVIASASFNGVNLIDESAGKVDAIGSPDGAIKITSNHVKLDAFTVLGGDTSLSITPGTVTAPATTASVDVVTTGTTWADGNGAQAKLSLNAVDAAIKTVTQALSGFGVDSKALDSQLSLVSHLTDSLNSGIGNLIDANMAQESATLQGLQTKQQLGLQALSIANSASQGLLSLFR